MSVDLVREKIRTIRKAKELRAADVADKIGVSRPFYTQLESGTRGLSVSHLFKIARALGVTIGELCGNIEDKRIAKMRGYVIPINDKRVWEILNPLLSKEPEDLSEWVIVLSEAVERLEQIKKEKRTSVKTKKQKNRMAG